MGTWDRESKGLTSGADRRQDSLVKLVCRTQWKALTRVAGSDRRYLRLIVSPKPYVVSIALRLQESSSPLSGHAALPADLGTGRGVVVKHAQLFATPPPTTLGRAAGFIDQLIWYRPTAAAASHVPSPANSIHIAYTHSPPVDLRQWYSLQQFCLEGAHRSE